MAKLKLTIQGMHCSSCANNVKRNLGNVSGVKESNISLLTRKAIVEAEDNVSEDELKKAVAKAGYELTSIEKD